ncbi:DUF2913 family protein [Photobacterium damselae]|uniref:DUF2913 family protein n=1 Tax=Photobacterium damselae TaxID=38293 RepID=UPI001F2E56EA|nr:DUF2913 family protein [Photobacterium damselae]UKA03959.1 DUF2913 family protein [Photobacterium damselae subsp. damselae]
MNREYNDTFSELVENALLHLYGQVALTQRYVPTIKRNEIIIKHLKRKLKSPKYKGVKTEIRIMLAIAGGRHSDIESRLLELNGNDLY